MKRTKRFLAMLLTLILCVGEISSAGFKVFAAGDENDTAEAMTEEVTEEEDNVEEAPSLDRAGKFEKTMENTRLDTKEMSGPKSLDLIWGGSFVYYGKQYTALGNKPLKYRVLDRSTTDFSNDINKKTMLLDCDTYIGQHAYKSGDTGVTSEWKDSDLKEYLNADGFLESEYCFTATERSAIAKSYKNNKNTNDGNNDSNVTFAPLTGEKIFVLDAYEAANSTYGFWQYGQATDKRRIKGDNNEWWLRSNYTNGTLNTMACIVLNNGQISMYYINQQYGVSPAYNIDLSRVLFSSAVKWDYGDIDAEYKLTVFDDNMNVSLDSGKKATITRSTVTIPYSVSGKNAGNAKSVNILILDKAYTAGNTNDAEIKYYGKLSISGDFATTGTGTFTLPDGLSFDDWGKGYKVYLIAEDINGEYETDYASAPFEISISDVEDTIAKYDLWVGITRVTEDNMGSIPCDIGKASYDPATNTLTFKDAKIINGYEYNTSSKRTAGIYAKGSNLTIKGNLTVDGTDIKDAICVEDTAANGNKLILDGDITVKGDYGISTRYTGVEINGGTLDIDAVTTAIKAGAPVSLGTGMKVLSPEGAEFKKSAYGDVYYLFESADSNVQVKKATIGSSSVTETYTVTFDLNGKSGTAPAAQTVEKGKTVSKPSDPSAEGLKFVAWCTDKEGKNVYDFATPVTADITLYAKWVEASADTFTVTFDLNGKSGTAPAAQTVEKGKTVSKPADPKADGFVFKAWCTDKEGKKEYDFSTPVTANITLYAKWEKAEEPVPGPDPIDGGKSALDPVPELIPGVTKDLYLVKGQKFNIGQGWYVDKADKDSKKRVSISKKGAFKAKAEGEAVIKCGSGTEAWAVNLHISKPKMDKKSLKIQLETETEVKTEKIGFTYDKDNLDVLWYSANPDVVTVDDSGNVTTIGKGSSKVTAYINGSAYTCTVTVKEKAALLERTLHVAKGASKSISIKGLKKPKWDESVKDIVSVKKNKVTGLNAGTTVLSFTQDEKVYKVTVIVEDLTMSGTGLKAQGKPGSNKYIIDELKAKDETILSFAGVTQSVVFKSSKPDIAFIDEDLNVVIRNKGKAKFTAKINGKPVTISVNIK